jgi:hypothetical protein
MIEAIPMFKKNYTLNFFFLPNCCLAKRKREEYKPDVYFDSFIKILWKHQLKKRGARVLLWRRREAPPHQKKGTRKQTHPHRRKTMPQKTWK